MIFFLKCFLSHTQIEPDYGLASFFDKKCDVQCLNRRIDRKVKTEGPKIILRLVCSL